MRPAPAFRGRAHKISWRPARQAQGASPAAIRSARHPDAATPHRDAATHARHPDAATPHRDAVTPRPTPRRRHATPRRRHTTPHTARRTTRAAQQPTHHHPPRRSVCAQHRLFDVERTRSRKGQPVQAQGQSPAAIRRSAPHHAAPGAAADAPPPAALIHVRPAPAFRGRTHKIPQRPARPSARSTARCGSPPSAGHPDVATPRATPRHRAPGAAAPSSSAAAPRPAQPHHGPRAAAPSPSAAAPRPAQPHDARCAAAGRTTTRRAHPCAPSTGLPRSNAQDLAEAGPPSARSVAGRDLPRKCQTTSTQAHQARCPATHQPTNQPADRLTTLDLVRPGPAFRGRTHKFSSFAHLTARHGWPQDGKSPASTGMRGCSGRPPPGGRQPVSPPTGWSQSGRTCSACGPFWPWAISNSTRWFSSRER